MDKTLLKQLKELNDESSRQYELALTKLAGAKDHEGMEHNLREILASAEDEQVRYNAFYCLNILNRREKDFKDVYDLLQDYGDEFRHHISFRHLALLYQLESDAAYDYDQVLKDAFEDAKLFRNHAGFLHLFSDMFVTTYESDGLDDRERFVNQWYDIALNMVNHAIKLEEYAKFYCTRARIRLIKQEFQAAEVDLNRAITLEDSNRHDYFLRINNYQYYKLRVYVEKRLAQMKKELGTGEEVSEDKETKLKTQRPPKPYEGSEPYVFISYAHADKESTFDTLRLLQKEKVRFWYDKALHVGDDYMETIGEKIRDCSAFVFMVSPDSVNSSFVRKEIHLGGECYGKKIFCFFLCDTELTPGMMLQFARNQFVYSQQTGRKEAVRQLANVLPEIVK